MGMVDPMNAQDMLDHALGQLEGPAREQAERETRRRPRPGRDVSTVSVRAIDRLLDDGEAIEAPSRSGVPHPRLRRGEPPAARAILDFVPVTRPVSLGGRRGRRLHPPGRPAHAAARHPALEGPDESGRLRLQPPAARPRAGPVRHQHHDYPYAPPNCPARGGRNLRGHAPRRGLLDDLVDPRLPLQRDVPRDAGPLARRSRRSASLQAQRPRPLPASRSAGTTPTTAATARRDGPGAAVDDPLLDEYPAARRPAAARGDRQRSCPATARTTAAAARTCSSPTCTSAGTTPGASAPRIPTCSSTTSSSPAPGSQLRCGAAAEPSSPS